MLRARVLIVLTTLLLAAMGSQATSYSIIIPVKAKGSGPLYRVKRDNKWGFMNRQGKIVIKPQFDEAHDFFDGLAAVQFVNAWGYIRESGEVAIPVTYDSASDFKDQRATVCRDDLCGVIDTAGTRLTRLEFSEVKPFSEGLAAVETGREERPFAENVVLTYGGKWGFIDRSGKIVIEPQFDHAQSFSEGLAAFGMGGTRDKKGAIVALDGAQWGFVDRTGHVVITAQFVQVEPFSQGVSAIWEKSEHWLIDRKGKRIAGPYKNLGAFSEGLACVKGRDGSGFIRPDGSMKIRFDSWEFVDYRCSDRNVIFSEGLVSVEADKKVGFLDSGGAIRIPLLFDHSGDFSEGLAAVREKNRDGLEGYIDKTGKLVIPLRFTSTYEFVDGLALVRNEDGRWDYIDTSGAIVARDVFHY